MVEPPSQSELKSVALGMVAAYNAKDLDGVLALAHPDIVHTPSRAVAQGTHVGHAGVREWWEEMLARDGWYSITVDEVLVLTHGPGVDAHPERSHLAILGEYAMDGETLGPWTALYAITDGLVIETQGYLSGRSLLCEVGILAEDTFDAGPQAGDGG